MKLYRYIIEHDDGKAPNYAGAATTLVICKPDIRRVARPGDLVLAFAGRKLSSALNKPHDPHAVVWAGLVREVLPIAGYWFDERFSEKKPGGRDGMTDNIYAPDAAGNLKQVTNGSHGESDTRRDLGGRNALIFGQVWRFSNAPRNMPPDIGWRWEGANRRRHRTDILDDAAAFDLIAWLNDLRKGQGVDAHFSKPTGRLSCD